MFFFLTFITPFPSFIFSPLHHFFTFPFLSKCMFFCTLHFLISFHSPLVVCLSFLPLILTHFPSFSSFTIFTFHHFFTFPSSSSLSLHSDVFLLTPHLAFTTFTLLLPSFFTFFFHFSFLFPLSLFSSHPLSPSSPFSLSLLLVFYVFVSLYFCPR